jgi:hypothetical protein
MSGRGLRRLLAALVAAWASVLLVGVTAATHPAVAASPRHCHIKPCDPLPSDTPKPQETPPANDLPLQSAQSQVQAAAAPTPYDDINATPGPQVGTLVTPPQVADVPIAAPVLQAHPQGESGLTALIVAGAVLALLTLLSITLAIAAR